MSAAGLNKRPRTNDRQRWATPAAFVRGVSRMLARAVDLDVCAEAHTAKAPRWFGPGSEIAEDAFDAPPWWQHLYSPGGVSWDNPPFCNIGPFVVRHLSEIERTRSARALVLVPPRTDTRWWAALANHRQAGLHAITGRVRFEPPNGVKPSSPPGGVVLWTIGLRGELPPVLDLADVLRVGDSA